MSKSARKMATNNNGDKVSSDADGDANADGWEGFDDEVEFDENDVVEASTIDFGQIEACAQLTVDLKKAQSACEQLAEQLTKAEAQRDQVYIFLCCVFLMLLTVWAQNSEYWTPYQYLTFNCSDFGQW